MKHIWKGAVILATAMMITACNNNKFTVEGQITNAKDSTLYFENVGLEGRQFWAPDLAGPITGCTTPQVHSSQLPGLKWGQKYLVQNVEMKRVHLNSALVK